MKKQYRTLFLFAALVALTAGTSTPAVGQQLQVSHHTGPLSLSGDLYVAPDGQLYATDSGDGQSLFVS